MKKFAKYILLFLLPLIVIMLPFFIGDPFMILRHYTQYYPADGSPLYINNNLSYVSTRMYIQNNDSLHYDSFIFGSSRSGYFLVEDWRKYIGDSAQCFHFNGYGESLYLVHKKLHFVNKHSNIRHVLIPIDDELLRETKPFSGPIWVTPIELLDYHQFNEFYSEHIRGYLTPKFWVAYTDLLLTKTIRPYMVNWGIVDTMPTYYLPQSHERDKKMIGSVFPDENYSSKLRDVFLSGQANASPTYGSIIKEPQKCLLEDIKQILDSQHAEYKIVLNPMWNQTRLSEEDMGYLRNLFGEHLYDFSGKTLFTQDYHNYHDISHFSVRVADKMMEIMYEPDSIHQRQMLDSIFMR